jgi:hypothetical protein
MNIMRNPHGFDKRFEKNFSEDLPEQSLLSEDYEQKSDQIKCNRLKSYCTRDFVSYTSFQYGYGIAVGDIIKSVEKSLPRMRAALAFVLSHSSEPEDAVWRPIRGIERQAYDMAAFTFLLMPAEQAADFVPLISSNDRDRGYLFDVLASAFIQGRAVAKKYKADKYSAAWTNPILSVLAAPIEQRAAGLAAHMKNWCRLMRQYDWTPTPKIDDYPFNEFAFEVALAVCAYDIDDSSFSDHPYYPRDLVEYYRANLRDTRDAWRPKGQGAGIPVIAPPPPAKADLSKSKRKNVARWVELVSDGNNDATEAVLEAIGKPRKFKDIGELMEALNDSSQAIHADIKDDATVVYQASVLAAARGLGEYEAPVDPPQGPARCSAALLHFARWLRERGYRLIDLDGQDDAWHAVLIKAEYEAELQALSDALGLLTRAPETVYND